MVEMGTKWVEMRKKHQNLLSNSNDAQSITKHGFLVRPYAQIVATARA